MSGARTRAAKVHAGRGWTCPCGRTVFGNGGKSSHQRACRTFKADRLAALDRTLARIEAGEWGGSLSQRTVDNFRHQYALQAARLREELGVAS